MRNHMSVHMEGIGSKGVDESDEMASKEKIGQDAQKRQ